MSEARKRGKCLDWGIAIFSRERERERKKEEKKKLGEPSRGEAV
jgi:hypothetical protein